MPSVQLFIQPDHQTATQSLLRDNDCRLSSPHERRSFVITAQLDDSVDKLRALIFHKTSIIPNRQILQFRNKYLQSGSRLEDYGLTNHCTISVRCGNDTNWFDCSRYHIDQGIIRLQDHIESLQREQSKIDSITQSLQQSIESAPSLAQLNRCNVDDRNDKEMRSLQRQVAEFRDLVGDGRTSPICNVIDKEMKSLQTLIQNAQNSVNHEETQKCNVMDKKIQSIDAEIKRLQDQRADLVMQKGTLQSDSVEHRHELQSLRDQHVTQNRRRVERLCAVDMAKIVESLKESKVARFKELEKESSEWDTENLEVWIRNISRGHFNRDHRGYDAFFENLQHQCIDGSNLQELASGVCLGLLGLTDEEDQRLLMQNVNGLLRMNMDNDFIVKGNRCCACLSKCIECVLCPCGHQPFCYECAKRAREHDNRCPICRSQITNVMRTFISGV